MIYGELLGNDLVRLFWVYGERIYVHFDRSDQSVNYMDLKPKSKVSFLRTCRQIYVEAMEVLYTTNTFGFEFNMHNLEPYCHFFRTIRPHRLASITSLRIECHERTFNSFIRPEAREAWKMLWRDMATHMPGLKDVALVVREYEVWSQQRGITWFGHEGKWVKPLLMVSGLRRFGLEVRSTGVEYEWLNGCREEVEALRGVLEERMCS